MDRAVKQLNSYIDSQEDPHGMIVKRLQERIEAEKTLLPPEGLFKRPWLKEAAVKFFGDTKQKNKRTHNQDKDKHVDDERGGVDPGAVRNSSYRVVFHEFPSTQPQPQNLSEDSWAWWDVVSEHQHRHLQVTQLILDNLPCFYASDGLHVVPVCPTRGLLQHDQKLARMIPKKKTLFVPHAQAAASHQNKETQERQQLMQVQQRIRGMAQEPQPQSMALYSQNNALKQPYLSFQSVYPQDYENLRLHVLAVTKYRWKFSHQHAAWPLVLYIDKASIWGGASDQCTNVNYLIQDPQIISLMIAVHPMRFAPKFPDRPLMDTTEKLELAKTCNCESGSDPILNNTSQPLWVSNSNETNLGDASSHRGGGDAHAQQLADQQHPHPVQSLLESNKTLSARQGDDTTQTLWTSNESKLVDGLANTGEGNDHAYTQPVIQQSRPVEKRLESNNATVACQADHENGLIPPQDPELVDDQREQVLEAGYSSSIGGFSSFLSSADEDDEDNADKIIISVDHSLGTRAPTTELDTQTQSCDKQDGKDNGAHRQDMDKVLKANDNQDVEKHSPSTQPDFGQFPATQCDNKDDTDLDHKHIEKNLKYSALDDEEQSPSTQPNFGQLPAIYCDQKDEMSFGCETSRKDQCRNDVQKSSSSGIIAQIQNKKPKAKTDGGEDVDDNNWKVLEKRHEKQKIPSDDASVYTIDDDSECSSIKPNLRKEIPGTKSKPSHLNQFIEDRPRKSDTRRGTEKNPVKKQRLSPILSTEKAPHKHGKVSTKCPKNAWNKPAASGHNRCEFGPADDEIESFSTGSEKGLCAPVKATNSPPNSSSRSLNLSALPPRSSSDPSGNVKSAPTRGSDTKTLHSSRQRHYQRQKRQRSLITRRNNDLDNIVGKRLNECCRPRSDHRERYDTKMSPAKDGSLRNKSQPTDDESAADPQPFAAFTQQAYNQPHGSPKKEQLDEEQQYIDELYDLDH